MPALFTSTVGAPSWATTACDAVSRDARSVISQSRRTTDVPARAATSANAGDGDAVGRSNAATRAPASTSASTHTGPSLPHAPVTTAVWLSSRKIGSITTRPSEKPSRASGSRPRELCARLAQHLERQEIVLVKLLQRDPAQDALDLVGRNAAARRFHDDVVFR